MFASGGSCKAKVIPQCRIPGLSELARLFWGLDTLLHVPAPHSKAGPCSLWLWGPGMCIWSLLTCTGTSCWNAAPGRAAHWIPSGSALQTCPGRCQQPGGDDGLRGKANLLGVRPGERPLGASNPTGCSCHQSRPMVVATTGGRGLRTVRREVPRVCT
jgi:hypothetical protein